LIKKKIYQRCKLKNAPLRTASLARNDGINARPMPEMAVSSKTSGLLVLLSVFFSRICFVAPLAQKHIDIAGMADRIKVVSGDFSEDDLPRTDVVTMGNILHDFYRD
jgi:hypothetical protein